MGRSAEQGQCNASRISKYFMLKVLLSISSWSPEGEQIVDRDFSDRCTIDKKPELVENEHDKCENSTTNDEDLTFEGDLIFQKKTLLVQKESQFFPQMLQPTLAKGYGGY